ncbi:MAG TPA: Holliday junction resolvase-like protein [Candidatus Acidoferrales bacterium]|nr:Holliday junction resolvase-like protein [Candidatus Acidoferrales bacterium]
MNKKSKAKDIIQVLEKRGFYAECPTCEETIKLKDCGLFYLDEFAKGAREVYERLQREQGERAAELAVRRKEISASSEIGAQAVNMGLILERLAPCMGTFRFDRNDCRSLFDPIDYLIFEGLSGKDAVSRILFMEVKTGGSPLKPTQRQIRSLIQSKKVSMSVYEPEKGK